MLVSLIAALDRRGLIGDERGLPWHLPSDLRRFRAHTWGKPIIMGRTTFELLGKPLPGRLNIVLTRNPECGAPGGRVARTFQEALTIAEDYAGTGDEAEAMIVGGGQVYAEAIRRWDRLYLTVVEGEFAGGTFFPVGELLRQSWRPAREPETHPPDEKNRYRHSFHILERAWDATRRSPPFDVDDLPRACAGPQTGLERLDLAALLMRGTVCP